jgi:pantothenate kinase
MLERVTSIEELAARARQLAAAGRRQILGITGAPGAGKSTLAEAITAELDGLAIGVPMDGFHLANTQLERLGRHDRKGAPDTFDAAGYITLLGRLKATDDGVVYAPEFRRELDEPIAGAIAVPYQVPLVVTDGNYLLLDEWPWGLVRGLLDEVWYLELEDGTRTKRLVSRHVRHGKSLPEAQEWVRRTDELNAGLVASTRDRADVLVTGLRLR